MWSCLKLRRVKSETNVISFGSKIVERLRRRQYDRVIIEMTIGFVLCPCTALYRSFIPRCTLTNKAVGTIWRALSKPSQRRQGPDPRPLWLLVGTPSDFGPELLYRLCEAQPTLMDVPIYFWYTIIIIYECRQAKRDLRDVESLRQNCGLFDVIEIAVPRKKSSGVPRYFPEFNNA